MERNGRQLTQYDVVKTINGMDDDMISTVHVSSDTDTGYTVLGVDITKEFAGLTEEEQNQLGDIVQHILNSIDQMGAYRKLSDNVEISELIAGVEKADPEQCAIVQAAIKARFSRKAKRYK